jgi:hypothetical protein
MPKMASLKSHLMQPPNKPALSDALGNLFQDSWSHKEHLP